MTKRLKLSLYQKAYAEFIGEFNDPELWEGHLKANPVPDPKAEVTQFIYLVAGDLIYNGQDVIGMTIGQILNLGPRELELFYNKTKVDSPKLTPEELEFVIPPMD